MLGADEAVSCLVRAETPQRHLVEIRIQPRPDATRHYAITRHFAVAYHAHDPLSEEAEVNTVVDRVVELLDREEGEQPSWVPGTDFYVRWRGEPTLFLLPGHIGHPMDVGARTLDILLHVRDVFVEMGLQDEARSFMRSVHISDETRTFVELAKDPARNAEALRALHSVAREGRHACLFGVGEGTPCFLDPGIDLVGEAERLGMRVLSAGGPSSLSMALMRLGRGVDEFIVLGRLESPGDLRRIKHRIGRRVTLPVVIFTEGHTCPTLLDEILRMTHWSAASLLWELTTDEETHRELDLDGDVTFQLSRVPPSARVVAWLEPETKTLRRLQREIGRAGRRTRRLLMGSGGEVRDRRRGSR